MNVALTFVNKMKAKLNSTKMKSNLKKGLVQCVAKLNKEIEDDKIYSLGLYCGNQDFSYIVFSANTHKGLQESEKAIDNDKDDDHPESSKMFVKWNAADWKYHGFYHPKSLEIASSVLGEVIDKMFALEECEETEIELTPSQWKELNKGKRVYDIDPNNTYYDLYGDVYQPIYAEIYNTLSSVLAEVKKEMNLSDNIFISLFCGDAPYDFMIQHGAKINSKATLKKTISDIEKYGELIGYEMFDEDYRKYLK